MNKAKLIKPISCGTRGDVGTEGTEVIVLATDNAPGLIAALRGINKVHAVGYPAEGLSEAEIFSLEDICEGDETCPFIDRIDELKDALPEGYVLTIADSSEISME